MWLTNLMIKRPCLVLIIGFGLLIYLTNLCIELDYLKLIDQYDRDFLIWDDPSVRNWDLRDLAYEYLDKYRDKDNGSRRRLSKKINKRGRRMQDEDEDEEGQKEITQRPLRVDSTSMDSTFVYQYIEKDFNQLLEKKNLLRIQNIENLILNDSEWPLLCRAQDDKNRTCHNELSYSSGLKIFDKVGDFKSEDLYKQTQYSINQAFKKGMLNKTIWDDN